MKNKETGPAAEDATCGSVRSSGAKMRRLRDGARVRGEQKCTRTRAGPDSWGEASAPEQKRAVGCLGAKKRAPGKLGQQRAPGCLRRAKNADAAVSCLRWVTGLVEVWGGGMGWRYGEMSWWGLAVRACRCGRERSRGKVLGNEGRGRAHRSPEERRAVAEAASSI